MKKNLLFITLFYCIGVFGQKITYSKEYNGDITAKDEYGNVVARGSKEYNGDIVWKDKFGNVIKRESKEYNGDSVSKDRYGNKQSSQSRQYNGDEVVKDNYGNVLYVLSTDLDILTKVPE